jgi:hypothetical protein
MVYLCLYPYSHCDLLNDLNRPSLSHQSGLLYTLCTMNILGEHYEAEILKIKSP